jgi:hypothetical protein
VCAPTHQGVSVLARKLRAAYGELRILDTELGERLGYSRKRDIRKTIERYLPDLDRLRPRATVAREPGASSREPEEKYYLNRRQAIFITAKSETEDATDITIEIIQRFDAYEQGDGALAITAPLAAAALALVSQQLATMNERLAAIEGSHDPARKSVKDAWTMAEILEDQHTAKPWNSIGSKCRTSLKRFAARRNQSNLIRPSFGPASRYLFNWGLVQAWLAEGGHNMLKEHTDAQRGQGVLSFPTPAPGKHLKPVPRPRELPPSMQGPA